MLLKKDPDSKKRFSDNLSIFPEQQKDIEQILEKYRGIKQNHLEWMNPYYSCVICKKYKITCSEGTLGSSCPEAELASEEEFALKYDF